MRWLLTLTLPFTFMLAAPSCTREPSKRTQDQLVELQRRKEAAAKAEKAKAERLEPLTAEVLHLPPPYDDSQALVVTPDGPCPEGLWALFPTLVPGSTPEEKQANEARRAGLAAALAPRTILVKLRAPAHITLQPFDAPKGRFLIELAGAVECTSPTGAITLTWTDAKPFTPPTDNEVAQNLWQAPPVRFELPMQVQSEAKAFFEANHFALSARVAFTPGKAEVDRKLKRVAKISQQALGETVGYGGGSEDWGAGPLLRGHLLGVRLATDREKKQLLEQRP